MFLHLPIIILIVRLGLLLLLLVLCIGRHCRACSGVLLHGRFAPGQMRRLIVGMHGLGRRRCGSDTGQRDCCRALLLLTSRCISATVAAVLRLLLVPVVLLLHRPTASALSVLLLVLALVTRSATATRPILRLLLLLIVA